MRYKKKRKNSSILKLFRHNDIAVRIYVSFAFVLAITLVLTGIIFIRMYQKNYIQSYTSLLTRQGKKISRRVTKFYANKNKEQFQKYTIYIDEIERAEQTDVWIVSNENAENPLDTEYTNAEMGDGTLTEEMYDVLQGAYDGTITSSSSYDKAYGMMILRVAIPVYQKNTKEVIGGVMMISMIDKQTMGMGEGKYLITMSAMLAFLISYVIAMAFSRYLSRPISKIEKDISRLASGDYSGIVTKSRSVQLGALEEKLDYLSRELAQAEREREGLEQARRDFFANVSHELRTPITVIRGYAETLTDGVVTDGQFIGELYHRILSECRGMERLVEDLFVLSKMQNPDFQMEMEPVSLRQIFTDVVRSGKVIGQEKEVSIRLNMPEEDPCMMLGDYGRLRQMFMVIIDNAVKFSDQGGVIEIVLEKENARFKISVRDYGVGISEEQLPYIFEKFYKSKMKQNEKGTGLGLMIARQIALRHGGEIRVESEQGKGSTFFFEFEELTSMEEYE